MENNEQKFEKKVKGVPGYVPTNKPIYIKGKDDPMTKAQRHLIVHKRTKVYTNKVLREYIANKYNLEFDKVDLQRLTKGQAQDIIINFAPHPKVKEIPEEKTENEASEN